MTRSSEVVKKGWGHELIWVSTDQYCGKLLTFNKGAKSSMHFHANKDETWLVLSGKFLVEYIDTTNASIITKELDQNDSWHNNPLLPHRLICLEDGIIIEVSTPDSIEDNYRVIPGDSQNVL
jgi:quercetin dioxygenase-like cupin family protein